jgi:hypothetical protein
MQHNNSDIFLNSSNKWSNNDVLTKILDNKTFFATSYNPVSSISPFWNNISYDKIDNYSTLDTPSIMRSKEEVSPEYLFNTY